MKEEIENYVKPSRSRNYVAKHARKFNKVFVYRDHKKYDRKKDKWEKDDE